MLGWNLCSISVVSMDWIALSLLLGVDLGITMFTSRNPYVLLRCAIFRPVSGPEILTKDGMGFYNGSAGVRLGLGLIRSDIRKFMSQNPASEMTD